MVTLREEVTGIQRRRREAAEENVLLKQLNGLWQRLCDEVEAEIQEGVRNQLGIQQENGSTSEDAADAAPRTEEMELERILTEAAAIAMNSDAEKSKVQKVEDEKGKFKSD